MTTTTRVTSYDAELAPCEWHHHFAAGGLTLPVVFNGEAGGIQVGEASNFRWETHRCKKKLVCTLSIYQDRWEECSELLCEGARLYAGNYWIVGPVG